MRTRRGIAVTLGIGFLSLLGNAEAQNVISTQIVGQPLVYMKDGNVNGCGVRLIVVVSPPLPSAAPVPVYDLSFNTFLPGYCVVKGSSSDVPSSKTDGAPDFSKERGIPLTTFWLKAKNKPATSPLTGTLKGEKPGSILYKADIDAVLPLFAVAAKGETILVGTKRQGENFERIFTGAIAMPVNEIEEVIQCLDEIQRVKAK